MKQTEEMVAVKEAKVTAKGSSDLGGLLAWRIGGAIIKRGLRASKERLEQERDEGKAVAGVSLDLGLDLLTGTVTRAPVDHAMTIGETRKVIATLNLPQGMKDDSRKAHFVDLTRIIGKMEIFQNTTYPLTDFDM